MRRRWGAVGAVLALLLAGCGGAASTSSSTSSTGASTSSSSTAATATAAAPASGPVKGGTLTIAFSQEPDTLDVAKTGLTAVGEIMRNVMDGLVWLGTDNKFYPDLATSWTVSTNGLTYTFQLRKDVKFTDGTPFNAQAAVANFDYVENPATHSLGSLQGLGPCTKAAATGAYTLTVTCTAPYAPFMTDMAGFGFQSPTAIQKEGSQYGLNPVGTGPFMVQKFVPNSEVVLVRNPNYNWAPSVRNPHGAAYLDKIVYQIQLDGQTRVDSLQSGQAQMVEGAPALSYKTMTAAGQQYVGLVAPIAGAGEYAVINNSKFPTNDVNVRKAILYSIDRVGLNQLADQGVYPVLWSPLQPGTLGFDATLNNQHMYSYDPTKAAQILTQDGWKKDSSGIWAKNGQELSIVITHIPVGDLPTEAQGIQSYLQKAGMKVTIQQYADNAWHAANVSGVENITPLEFSSLDPDLLRIEFTPGQYFNWSKVNIPSLTTLLAKAETETNPTTRLQMYDQAQQILMDNAVMIPEHENDDLYIMSPKVKGITVLPGGSLDLYSAYLAQ